MSDSAVEAADISSGNKRVALLIAALALALALTQVVGDDAKTEAQMKNVESANLWAFFQARTIRQTILGVEADRATFDDRQPCVLTLSARLYRVVMSSVAVAMAVHSPPQPHSLPLPQVYATNV